MKEAQPFIDKYLHFELKDAGKNAPLKQLSDAIAKEIREKNTDEELDHRRDDIFLQYEEDKGQIDEEQIERFDDLLSLQSMNKPAFEPTTAQSLCALLKSPINHPLTRLTAALALLLPLAAGAGDWPQFRGPFGNGVAHEDKAPLHWRPEKNVLWKAALPGPGNSSPIVSHGRVFITCAEDSGKKRNLYCFDRRTGKELWVRTVAFPIVEPTHESNPYCASTPAADRARVVVWHGSAGVFCYNFDGKELWKKDLGAVRNEWGYGSSPILYRGKVILNFGPGDRAFLAALDLKTGKLLWKYDEPGGPKTLLKGNWGSWCTPIVAKVGGKDQVLCSLLTRVVACDPKTGACLWFFEGLAEEKVDLIYASPVVSGDIGVAFTGWANGPTIGFKLGGTGDVTASNRLWLQRQSQRIGSGVVVDGHVFIVNAGPGTAQCMECQTGKVGWTERLDGGESWGSVVLAAGRLYVTSRRGVTTVFRPSPEKLEVLAMNDLGEPSNATPAVSDGQIFLRTDGHLYCIAED